MWGRQGRLLTPGARYADEHDEYVIEPHPLGNVTSTRSTAPTSGGEPLRQRPARHDVDVARLSPPGHAPQLPGRYAFTTQPPADLRPLRDPNARDAADDDF
jgi:hypothetical protein